MWNTFADKLKLDSEIPRIMNEVFKFEKITKVQHIVINEFIKNEDVIVKSVTGSGKTLSYIIPMFQRLITYSKNNNNYANNVLCLILLPSRELSMQVYENVMQFINNTSYKFTAQLLIGGKKVDDDISKIKETIPNIIIATPGRFIDIDDKEKLSFSELQLLILDEADRMLDMGFEVAVSQILSKLPKQRRTGLFSATVTSNVENIIKAGMRNPVFIDINVNEMNKDKEDIFISEKDVNNKISRFGKYYKVLPFTFDNDKINNSNQEVPTGLNQYYREIENIKYKIPHLIQILNGLYNSDNNKKIMIFLSTCNLVDYFSIMLGPLFTKLSMTNFSISKLHSKISQNKREKEYKTFRDDSSHKLNLLLTTDLAARGIDVPDVDMIIQYDPPKTEDSYIHKAGRTARVGNTGVSLLFLTKQENPFITYMKNKQILIEKFPLIGEKEEEVDEINKMSVLNCIKEINLSDKWIYDKAVNSFISYLRFYKEIELKYIFDFRSLDIGNLANSFQLVKMPRIKMKEFLSDSIKNFVPDLTVAPKEIQYKDKNIEKQMNEKKEKIIEKMKERELKKEEEEKNKEFYKPSKKEEKKANRTRKQKKEAKIKAMIDEWDDLADDDKLYKKFKKGKITKEEYEKALLKLK